jgi:hypothetical protein
MAARRKSVATQFSSFLKNALDGMTFHKIESWDVNWRIPGTRDTVDVAGIDRNGEPRVLVEVERLRDNPVSNVVKIWHSSSELGRLPTKILVVQAFSGAFNGPKSNMRERAIFVGKMLHRNFPGVRYLPLDFPLFPKSGAKVLGGASKHEAKRIARQVHRFWAR